MRIEADAMVRDQGTKTIQDLGYRVHEVLTSGFYDFPPASDLLRELGFEFIQKPFTPTELADKVKSILSQPFRKVAALRLPVKPLSLSHSQAAALFRQHSKAPGQEPEDLLEGLRAPACTHE